MDAMSSLMRGHIDRLGILLSSLCALHCAASIALVMVLGASGAVLLNPAIHKVGLVVAALTAMVAIGVGTLRHRRVMPAALATGGLSFLGAAVVAGHGLDELLLTAIGLVLVAAAHLVNLRRC